MTIKKKIIPYLLSLWLIGINVLSAQQYAYVSNQTSITQVNLLAKTSQNLNFGITDAKQSVVSPDQKTLYIVDGGAGTVRYINLTTNPPTDTGTSVPVGVGAEGIAITADGKTLVVANPNNINVLVIDVATQAVTPVATAAGNTPLLVAISGTNAYVVSGFNSTFTAIDLINSLASAPVTIPGALLFGIAITPAGDYAYLSDFAGNNVIPLRLSDNTIFPTILTGAGPRILDISSTNLAYVPNSGATPSSTVTGFNATTPTPPNTSTIILGGQVSAYAVAFSNNGLSAYVTNYFSGSLSVINVAAETKTSDIIFGGLASYLSLSAYPVGAPTITALNPSSGPVSGTNKVNITGTGFFDVTGVSFGPNPATNVIVNSDTSITVTAPAGIGNVNVTVTTVVGPSASSAGSQYTYLTSPVLLAPSVTVLTPSSGQFGQPVTISGTGFTGATAVTFDGVSASFFINSDTSITAFAPAGTGTVSVVVTNAIGPSTITPASQFTYTVLPFPPRDVKGFQCKRFKHPVNTIRFKAPREGVAPVSYRIYRDPGLTILAKKIRANRKLQFKDRNRECGVEYSYYIVSVNASGMVSIPSSVTVRPR